MAATGRDVPWVQRVPLVRLVPYVVLVLLFAGRDPRRSGRGLGHDSIPAAGRRGRARHCVCGLAVRVDTWGSVGRPPPGRDAGTSGAEPVRAGSWRSCLAPARARPPSRAGGVRWGNRRPGRVPSGRAPSRSLLARALASPRFLAPRVRPVNVLSGHSDDVSQVCVERPSGDAETEHLRPPRSTRRARPTAYACVALVSQKHPSGHTCHASAGLASHPGTAPDRPSPDVVHPEQAW